MYSTQYVQCINHLRFLISHPPHIALQAELDMNIIQVLTFAPTEIDKCIQFPIADDDIALEPNETLVFQLVLSENVTDVLFSPFDVTYIIIQDDEGELVL